MKYLGLFLVLVALLSFAVTHAHALERRKRETAALLALLTHIRVQIASFQKPLSEIIASYDNKDLQKCGFLEEAKTNGIAAAARRTPPLLSLSETGREIFLAYADTAGLGYVEEELRRLSLCEKAMQREADRLISELPKEKKLSRALCLSGGLAMLLLFW